jgi:disulfide bond formation protein DsbB
MNYLLEKISTKTLYYVILAQAAVAMGGSLYYSEVMDLPPCILCWFQRIAMYPLVILVAMGIARGDKKLYTYILSLSLPGLAIALYHNLLYWQVIPLSEGPCKLGISCTAVYMEWFGFITIPFQALVAFTVITVLAFVCMKRSEREL